MICYAPVAVLIVAWLLRIAGVPADTIELPFWPAFIASVWLYIRATRRKLRGIHDRARDTHE